MSCSICVENYNKSTRKIVECLYCNHQSCRGCVQKYLLSISVDPKCMSCNSYWSSEFVDDNFTKVFRDGDLRKHRELVLFDREKAMLPDTQSHVTARLKEIELREKIAFHENRLRIEYLMLVKKEKGFIADLRRELDNLRMNNSSGTSENSTKKFIKKCPVTDCKGFLSTNWVCGLCQGKICKDCNEVNLEDHVCNEEAKKTMELINKDCKPCPSCATPIHKIAGCDQMFCVDCKTAFSWNKGTIEAGVIHNPHYYQWVRNNNNGTIPRNPLDIPCGGLPGYAEVSIVIRNRALRRKEAYIVSDIHILVSHIHNYEMPRFRIRDPNNLDLRMEYLMGELNEEEFKRQLHIRQKNLQKHRDYLHIYQMFTEICSESFRFFVYSTEGLVYQKFVDYVTRFITETNSLIEYFNESISKVGKRYNCVYPGISYKYKYVPNYVTYKTRNGDDTFETI